jgi:FhaA, N-terminal domain/FHA domain
MGLQEFEQRLERLVEETLAKPFRSNLQPVEIGRRLTREMDLHRRVGVHGLIAPNYFMVLLATEDLDRFGNFLDALCRELADAAREHARIEGYSFIGPVQVEIVEGNRLRPGRFTVSAEVVEGPDGLVFAELVLPDGQRLTVGTEPVVMGRLPECDIVLTDPNVSRRHAEVRRLGDQVMVADLGSTNGTRVNGVPIREQRLESGDEISLGSTTLRFEMS